MNARLAKEWRPLRLPACIAAGAALLPLVIRFSTALLPDDMITVLLWGAQVAFVLAIPLLAASSYGAEFHHRTFGLLLAQPAERYRLWKEKLGVLCAVVGALGLLWLAQNGLLRWLAWERGGPIMPGQQFHFALEFSGRELVTPALLLLAVVSSAAFWTMVARSTLGGLVFSLAGSFLPLALLVLLGQAIQWASGSRIRFETIEPHLELAFWVTLPIYSGLFLWLGWRTFARLELKDTVSTNLTSVGGSIPLTGGLAWLLRCRPTGGGLNLVRKETRLQRPLLMVAGVFTLGWLAVALLRALLPDRGFETILMVAAIVYCPLTVLLAGALSLGEERNLGVSDWQLTLPVSARRQWAVKLAVGLVVAFLMGVLLPFCLAWATLPQSLFDLEKIDGDAIAAFSLVFGTAFFLSFWAATLLRNTIQAVVAAVASAGVMALSIPAIAWLADRAGGLQTGLLRAFLGLFHLPPDRIQSSMLLWLAPWAVAAAIAIMALVQSSILFRRPQAQRAVLVRYVAILLAAAFLGIFWCADLHNSAQQQRRFGLIEEISPALQASVKRPPAGSSAPQVTLPETEA